MVPQYLCAFLCLLATPSIMLAGDNDSHQQTRPLEPTEEELAAFSLTEEDRELVDHDGRSFLFHATGVGMLTASAADVATTEWAFKNGFVEGNPIAEQRAVRIGLHAVGPAVVYWASDRLARDGKTKAALALRIVVMVAYSYAAIHNTRLVTSQSAR